MPTPHYGQPRYRTIADAIRGLIATGALAPGTLLPTETALKEEFRASRGTVRQAISVLRAEGLVVTEHGRGTYVSPEPTAVGAALLDELSICAGDELARLLEVDIGSPLLQTRSIKRVNDRPAAVIYTYRPSDSEPKSSKTIGFDKEELS